MKRTESLAGTQIWLSGRSLTACLCVPFRTGGPSLTLATADVGDDPAAPTGEARVIVVTSGKGGVGKTTSTANIGSALLPPFLTSVRAFHLG